VDKGLTWVFIEQGETAPNSLLHIWVCKKNKKKKKTHKHPNPQQIIYGKTAKGTSSRHLPREYVIPTNHYSFSLCSCSVVLKNRRISLKEIFFFERNM